MPYNIVLGALIDTLEISRTIIGFAVECALNRKEYIYQW